MSIGPYLTEFNRAYLGSRDLARREGRADLEESMTLENLRQQGQEAQDLGALTSAFQARRAALANQPPAPLLPGGQPTPGPEQLAGPPAEPPTASIATPAPLAGAPAGEAPRRQSLLETMQPDVAGRLLRSRGGRMAIKDLEDAEKEHTAQENRRKAEEVWGVATQAMKDGDALGYYDHVAKAMRIVGNHEAAAKYLEHAMNLRGDAKEEKGANEDLTRWFKLQSTYQNDPSPENYTAFLDGLGEANSKTSRALRVQIAQNVLAKTFNQNPQVTGFSRSIAGAYRDAFASGADPNAEQIFRGAAAKDPQGFNAYIYDALVNHKQLPEVVTKKVLRWDVLDAKEVPKDVWSFSFARTKAKYPDLKPDDPRFMEAWYQDLAATTKRLAEEKRSPADEEKGIRADVSELRKRLGDVRAELRRNQGMADEDPERYRDLRAEEKQAVEDLKWHEGRLRKSAGAPSAQPKDVEIPVNRPSPKLKPDSDKYKQMAMSEIGRLKAAGYPKDKIRDMMTNAGWQ